MSHKQSVWYDKHLKEWRLYPHLTMVRVKGKENVFKCAYCKRLGTVRQLERVSCPERPEPCKRCGETPLCAPDCVGVRMALSMPGVYVIGKEKL